MLAIQKTIAFQKQRLKIKLIQYCVNSANSRAIVHLKFKGDLQAIVKLGTGKIT